MDVLRKLANTHYLFHVHSNNYGKAPFFTNGAIMLDVFECTYVAKRLVIEVVNLNKTSFPDPKYDRPNKPGDPDHAITSMPYVFT